MPGKLFQRRTCPVSFLQSSETDRVQAREAYEKALELEPDDRQLQEMRHKADVQERKQAEERKHKFKSMPSATAKRQKNTSNKASTGGSGPMSFDDGEDE